jgi:iron complex outermembrane receptor protein
VHTIIRSLLAGGAAAAVFCAAAGEASAQSSIALPGISVKTAKRKPAKVRKAKRKPAPRRQAEASAAGPRQQPVEQKSPLPGVLVVDPDAFAPTVQLTSDELRRLPAATLGDALSSKPGVTGSTFAPGGASRPVIGGLDNFRVRIQENGVGSGDVSALGEDHGVPIDPLAAEKIEVIRGPETLRYGGQAIGGVVEATNNRIPDRLQPAPGFSVETRSAYTSVNHALEGAALIDASEGPVAVHADFFKRDAGDYAIPGGRQANSALTAEGKSLGFSWIGRDGYMGVAATRFASVYHVPGLEAAAADTRIDMEQYKVTGKGEARFKDSDLSLSALRFWWGASNYRHYEIGVGEDGSEGRLATYKDRTQEARAEVDARTLPTPFGPLKSTLGAAFSHNEIGTSGEAGNLLAPAETTAAAGYVFDELRLSDALSLRAAGRIESVHVSGTAAAFPSSLLPPPDEPGLSPAGLDFTPKSVAVGVTQKLPYDFVLSVDGRYVERAPHASELFSKGAHDAPKTFEIGDPNLTPETARTAEIGLKRAAGALRLDASVYYTQYSDFIFKQFTGVKCDEEFSTCGSPDAGLDQVAYSQRDAVFRGAQVAAQYDLAKFWGGTFGVEAQYDFVRATFAGGGNVPRIPPHRLGGGAYWRDANWFAHMNMLHAFAQNDASVNETPTDGYDLLRAELSYTVSFGKNSFGVREATLSLVGDNLLDSVVRNSVSLRKDEVQEPGRSIRLVGSLKF